MNESSTLTAQIKRYRQFAQEAEAHARETDKYRAEYLSLAKDWIALVDILEERVKSESTPVEALDNCEPASVIGHSNP